ncbi:fic family toxin-antitoxin system, toxin component [Streptomyces sp. NBC_01476]|uniref:fic family toxin-antitoxin system, toxin component n=1 Tax=Streptomyces sp. NBC_01476 TaxID=2903881 RepID=UPI002E3239AF|nr:fic family toxin-antitoxin system, toxin component [Streptomyces sp. NBC_01476]
MSQPEQPTLDVSFLLHAAERLPGDPQVDDLGPLFAAAARVQAHAMERDVYGSVHLKAAALLHTLVALPPLEHSNEPFAWASCEAYLALHGIALDYEPKEAVALVRDTGTRVAGIAQIARQLRTWTRG